jgi:hypothetical protein
MDFGSLRDGVAIANRLPCNLIASIQRAMKWEEEQEYIRQSPLTRQEEPRVRGAKSSF